ncbi:MAG: isochorismatase family protein [Syntrophorhabdales bacterium]|jgi:nicotinamidase/pyrazinamidase
MNKKYGVIVTDIQGCFTTWKNGSLAVPGSDEIYVKSVEVATRRLKEEGFFIVATQDWHPPDHVSFASNHPGKKPYDTIEIFGRVQVLWPVHCVQGTEDARLLIDSSLFDAIVRKAQDPRIDSYSALKDDSGTKTGLDAIFHERGVTSTVIFGIATDYCVKATAIDLVRAGFKVVAVEQLCKGVTPETSAQALKQMQEEGVTLIRDLDMEEIRSLM